MGILITLQRGADSIPLNIPKLFTIENKQTIGKFYRDHLYLSVRTEKEHMSWAF